MKRIMDVMSDCNGEDFARWSPCAGAYGVDMVAVNVYSPDFFVCRFYDVTGMLYIAIKKDGIVTVR